MKTSNREPQISSIVEIGTSTHFSIRGRGFTIGYSSGPPERRVRGSDHRDHVRTEDRRRVT
jgi:hypothetical protein